MSAKLKLVVRFTSVLRRFPITFAFLGILIIAAFVMGAINLDDKNLTLTIWYLFNAAFLSAAMKLLREEKHGIVLEIVLQLALLGFWIYACRTVTGDYDEAFVLAMASISVLVFIACFINSFYRDRNDVPLVNFTIRMVVVLLASGIVTLAFMLAIFLIMSALHILFKVNVTDYAFFMTAVISWGLLFPTLLLEYVPEGEAKHDYSTDLGKFISGVAKWLILPITAVYMLILYVYAIKILVTWTLPNGWVSIPITVCFALCLLLLFLLYPEAYSENEKPLFREVRRWLPVALLPLLILMSVGIFKRIDDYGFTVKRLYLLLFNLWCYGTCFGLVFSRGKRLWWIPATFALGFLLSSVGPWNFSTLTEQSAESVADEQVIEDQVMMDDSLNGRIELSEKDIKLNETKDSVTFDVRDEYGDTLKVSVPREVLKELLDAEQ
jgi:hypothetical protein